MRLMMQCAALCVLLGALTNTCLGMTVAKGPGATGITVADGFLDEARLTKILLAGGARDCFLRSIRITGIETCQIGILPALCVRIRNNMPMSLMEATGKRAHITMLTIGAEIYLQAFSANMVARPTAKKLGQSMTDFYNSSIGRVNARVLAPPLVVDALFNLLRGATLNTLCKPLVPNTGYIYFSEGDSDGLGSIWRSIISNYYFNGATSAISHFATATRLAGMCNRDLTYTMCIGGFGTKYPTDGYVPAGSPALRVVTGMWRANEVVAASYGYYGPYQTSMGPLIHAQLHLPLAMAAGTSSFQPTYSPGSYMQFLYPGVGAPPVGVPTAECFPLGVGPGTDPMVMTQMVSEVINDTWTEEDSVGFAYWTRFTCCQNCGVSDAALTQDWIPEKSYNPTLTRVP